MALQVWLPLSGSTINYGLDQSVTITETNTYYADGVLGGRALRGGFVTVELSSAPTDAFSIAFWFKATSAAANAPMISFGDTSLLYTSEGHYKFSGSLVTAEHDIAAPNASWHHLAITADGTKVKVYLNGALSTTLDQANDFDSVFTSVNKNIVIGSADWVGYINDVKVDYNVFSHKLIHDMAKGLVLEYTFNHAGFGGPNLLVGAENNVTITTSSTFVALENNDFYADLSSGTYTLSAQTDGTWATTNSTAGQDPTKKMVALEVYQIDGSNSSVVNRTFYDMSEGFVTFDIVSDGRYFIGFLGYSDGSTEMTATISFIKLELGSDMTAYAPPANSQLFEDFGLNTEEIEVSGNKYNGDFGNIKPIWVSDTAVFSGAYSFANGGSIKSPELNLAQIQNNFTISIWARGTTAGKLFDTDSGLYVDSPSTILDNQWHQIVITPNGLYIDGALSSSASYTIGNGRIYFGKLHNGSTGWNGLLSDFRLYNRIFTDDEISKLHTIKASIDNSGQFFANEFISGFKRHIAMDKTRRGVINALNITTRHGSNAQDMTPVEKFNIGKNGINAVELIEAQ